jgi:two-component system, LytTR family, response regulator
LAAATGWHLPLFFSSFRSGPFQTPMEKLAALIVDDEEKAVILLNKLLADTEEFCQIRSAYSPSAAKNELLQFKPDLIFLDVQMPEMDGFTLLRDLHAERTGAEVIFVTAYDKFMLDAIRNHAFGYLLKPVNRNELNHCIIDYKKRRGTGDFFGKLGKFLELQQENSKLRFNTRAGYFFINPANILYCQADGNYSSIHTGDKEQVCSLQLGAVQEMLPKNSFVRLGRSLIINFRFVSSVDRKKNVLLFEKEGKVYSIKVSDAQLKELEKIQAR